MAKTDSIKRQINVLKLAYKFAPAEWKMANPISLQDFIKQQLSVKPAIKQAPQPPPAPVDIAVSVPQKNGDRILRTMERCAQMGKDAEVLGGLMQ